MYNNQRKKLKCILNWLITRDKFCKHICFRIIGRGDLIHSSKREYIYSNGKFKEQRKVEKIK